MHKEAQKGTRRGGEGERRDDIFADRSLCRFLLLSCEYRTRPFLMPINATLNFNPLKFGSFDEGGSPRRPRHGSVELQPGHAIWPQGIGMCQIKVFAHVGKLLALLLPLVKSPIDKLSPDQHLNFLPCLYETT